MDDFFKAISQSVRGTRKHTLEDTSEESPLSLLTPSTRASILADDLFNFSAMVYELPDPNQELSIQLFKPLDVFHPFPELPIEIRLRIWRLTFPKHRNMNLDPCYGLRTRDMAKWLRPRTIRELPVTLCINQESREEALRHYTILYQGDLPGAKKSLRHRLPYLNVYSRSRFRICDRPFCIDPRKESLWIYGRATTDGCELLCRQRWLEYVDSKLPGGLKSIRSLEVLCVDLSAPVLDLATIWGVGLNNRRGGLEWFHGLKSLHLMLDDDFNNRVVGGEVDRVKECYRRYQLRVPSCCIPEITVTEVIPPRYSAL
ncbi:uncharacterized protein PAC_18731 [Phialocephala subalpina]|uniref:2EXR domain-containing protein n=1 Tax=Phialocephala subalpina TaxID=576137 RepID=A0A1L7XUY3_9HELO|nr:uncharacterized protein PAC_18731 [Phialocephala subalpina]